MTADTDICIRPVTESDKPWVREMVRGWGADFIVSRGRKVYPDTIGGILAEDPSGQRLGLLTFEIVGDECEIVTLDAFEKCRGVGTALIEELLCFVAGQETRRVRRVWLITTNDNLDAIRFYQRRGFTIAAVHAGAIEQSRRIKPSIPRTGNYGIPIRDEIEFEILP